MATITLNGENTFGLQAELDTLAGKFSEEHGDLALERVDCEEADIDQIRAALTGLPFLTDKKMVVLRRPSTNKQFTDQVEQLLGEVPDSTDVILIEPKLDKRQAYYKFLKKETDFREFPELDLNGLATWLIVQVKQQKATLSMADARYLAERVGLNQQLLSSEIDKLVLYSPTITRETIDLLTEPTPQSTIFQLLDAAFAGNAKRALKLYREQRAMKVEPVQIIAMLGWQLNVLAIIKTAGDRPSQTIAKEAKLNPYVVSKSQRIAGTLPLPRLKQLIQDLLKIDIDSKNTNLDADEALQQYVLELTR